MWNRGRLCARIDHIDYLKELARHQAWADAEHWKAFHASPSLLDDDGIRKRLSHMIAACEMLVGLVRGTLPDMAALKRERPVGELEPAMTGATAALAQTIESADPSKVVAMPRGPKGPWEAPADAVLLQALTHSQHHRAQNAARMTELGVKPPMTDFILWYAQGRP